MNERHISELATAHGLARVLAVGVSTQVKVSGFRPLAVCANDASAVRDRFADIQQLHADPNFRVKCVSGGAEPATRGQSLDTCMISPMVPIPMAGLSSSTAVTGCDCSSGAPTSSSLSQRMHENGKQPRVYVLDLASGKVRPVTAGGVTSPFFAPDGRSLIARNPQREFALYPLDGGAPQPVKGLKPGETPVQFGTSGELYIWNGVFPAHIMAVDLASGGRQLVTTLAPADPAGVLYGEVVATPDGKTFAYRYRRAMTNLFLAEGLK